MLNYQRVIFPNKWWPRNRTFVVLWGYGNTSPITSSMRIRACVVIHYRSHGFQALQFLNLFGGCYIFLVAHIFMFSWHSQKWRKAGSVGWPTGPNPVPPNWSQLHRSRRAPGLHIHIDQRFGFAPSAEGAWEGLRSQTSQLLVLLALKKRDERIARLKFRMF